MTRHRSGGKPFPHILTRFLLPALLLMPLAGCGSDGDAKPDKIEIDYGNSQCAALGTKLKKQLRVKVLTARKRGLLGGAGSRQPAAGTEVRFRIVGPGRGAKLTAATAETDAGGIAGVGLVLGKAPGDVFIEASLPGHEGVSAVRFRAAGGLVLEGDKQEAGAGETLEKPIAVVLAGADGKPLAGVPVEWHIEKAPKGTKLVRPDSRTDQQGRAAAQIEMGSGTGRVIVGATVLDAERRIGFRTVRFKIFSLSPWNLLIVVIGGLAIFIMGMRIMTDGLARVAGARMKAILKAFTHNRVVGVGVGALITGVVQSSSATSVMVIGFVNAGLLTLERAIGLILGANIGTTVTAQMISFKLTRLALPAVALGVAIQLISKRKTTKQWGLVLAGFGLLFTGLTTMSGVLKGLQHSPTIKGFFSSIDCAPAAGGGMPLWAPLAAIAIGALVTFLVQSSSAAIGLLLVLSATGLINFYTAVPILLGSNIGTTTTAMLAVIGANRGARRTAVAHALFNVIGSALMYALFFVPYDGHPIFLQAVDWLTSGDGFAGENISRHIANAHTLFNVTCTLVFLPLVPVLAWACRRVVPETAEEKEEQPSYLEPHLLATPALALDRAKSELVYMTKLSRKAIAENFAAFSAGKMPDRSRLDRREERIDELQHNITAYLVKLSQGDLIEAESWQLPLLMHAVNDAERIGDHAENLLELAERRHERRLPFSGDADRELGEVYGEVEAMFGHVLAALEEGDRGGAERALRCEARINDLAKELARNHVTRLETGACNLVSGVVFLDIIANLEKVGDHLTNIAEAAESWLRVKNGG